MSFIWIKFFVLVALLQCTVVVESYPANNDSISVSDSIELTRYRRQINSVDSKVKSLVALAILASMCSDPGPSKQQEKGKGCIINVKDLPYKQALIVNPYDHTKFYYPDQKGNIYFAEHRPVFLSCPGSTFSKLPNKQFETFLCVCEDTFAFGDKLYKFNELTCNKHPESTIKDKGKIDNVFDLEEEEDKAVFYYHKYEIGFDTDSDNFLSIISVIYDDHYAVPWYAKSTISKNLEGRQNGRADPSWKDNYCCNGKHENMNNLYNQDTQDTTFKHLLFSHTKGPAEDRYLKKGTGYVFNRGHLTHKASLIYLAERRATFAYLNAAPQWKIINDGNWARTEEHIIEMAKKLGNDLTVYTGVYDILVLKDTADKDEMKAIYLYATKQRENLIREFPVPRYMYKLVIDLEGEKGVVFVTVNDPYIKDPAKYHLCDNPMIKKNGVTMPNWKTNVETDLKFGYSYMCTVTDFVAKTGMIPEDLSPSRLYDENSLLYIPGEIQGLPEAAPLPAPPTAPEPAGNKDLHQKQET